MPEGHTIHRLARDLAAKVGTGTLHASALQPNFAAGVARIDGGRLVSTDAWGKHLFARVAPTVGPELWLHVHLGLYGRFTVGTGDPPAARGALRLRLQTDAGWADLRGAIASELLDDIERDHLVSRLGPDPLRPGSDSSAALARITRSRVALGALLMKQDVLAGVGNVYRAEILHRHRLDPFRPGRDLDPGRWPDLWDDLADLMRAGVNAGRIVTTRPEDRPEGRRRRSAVRRVDSFYVYRRAGLPCRICGTEVRTDVMAARNLYWCPVCQVG